MPYASPPKYTLLARAIPDITNTPANPTFPLNAPTPTAPSAEVTDVRPLTGPYHVELSAGVNTDDTKLQCCEVRSCTYDSRNTKRAPTTYFVRRLVSSDVDEDDEDDEVDSRESSLPTRMPDPPSAAAHPRVVLIRAPRGPFRSNTDPYQSSSKKLTGDMNVMARG